MLSIRIQNSLDTLTPVNAGSATIDAARGTQFYQMINNPDHYLLSVDGQPQGMGGTGRGCRTRSFLLKTLAIAAAQLY